MSAEDTLSKVLGTRAASGPIDIGRLSGPARTDEITRLTRALTGFSSRPRDAAGRRKWDSQRRSVRRWTSGARQPGAASQQRLRKATGRRPNARARRFMRNGGEMQVFGQIKISKKVRNRWIRAKNVSPAAATAIVTAWQNGNVNIAKRGIEDAFNEDVYASASFEDMATADGRAVEYEILTLEDLQMEPD